MSLSSGGIRALPSRLVILMALRAQRVKQLHVVVFFAVVVP